MCEWRLYRAVLSWLIINLSLYLDSAALHFIFVHTADFGRHTEITLQGVLNRGDTLRLFIENEALELQMQANRTWTPAQRPYILFSPLRTLPDGCAYVGAFIRHPRCGQSYK